jgi:DNA replication protein DnaC
LINFYLLHGIQNEAEVVTSQVCHFLLHYRIRLVPEIYQHPRRLSQLLIASLLQNDWVHKHQNLLITAPCGSGKTCIACALAHAACMKEYIVKYYRLSRLLIEVTQSKADGSYSKALQALSKLNLLILDDWGAGGWNH